ncbi:hypothetical protein ACJ72_01704 [Emergomyces africanus]|uniref:Protein kinase domain-containing protein n=1 Tax=Emergomyces africanus TaxID=1955775 RepID=A0A1B7P4M9_9EURO|nr:hypothetical protein ACJ72_01704 [Emergomyces africanus]
MLPGYWQRNLLSLSNIYMPKDNVHGDFIWAIFCLKLLQNLTSSQVNDCTTTMEHRNWIRSFIWMETCFRLVYHLTALRQLWPGKTSEDISLAEARISLTDFGEAFSPLRELKCESRTPLVIGPPEARFEPEKPSLCFPSDIWTPACSNWAIIAQRPLFERFMAAQDDMTREHFAAFGVLPQAIFRSWDDRFEDSVKQPFDSEERNAVSSMLQSMLAFRPENRPPARQSSRL